jgi:hypothetical protein
MNARPDFMFLSVPPTELGDLQRLGTVVERTDVLEIP